MRLGNTPKIIFEEYWLKYADDRQRLSIRFNTYRHRIMATLLWILYQPYKWFLLVPLLLCSTICLSVPAFVVCLFSTRAARYFAVSWARINSFFTPMSIQVTGREFIDPKQSYIIVANHQSLYDIYVLYGCIGIDFKWVMKKELERIPFLGPVCKSLGHIFIDRSNTDRAVATINAAKEKIKNGTSVIFFPEGSRSSDGKTGPFKKGAFKLALDLGLPVLPVTLSGTHKILPKGSVNLMPGSVEMIIHPPIDISGYNEDNMKKLIIRSRAAVISGQPRKRLIKSTRGQGIS